MKDGNEAGPSGSAGLLREIERLREENSRLRRAAADKERAEETARSRLDFLARMSHEIRTPMNAIVGISEILLHGGGAPGEQRKYVGDIKMSATSLLTVINDILDISKLEAGKLALSPAPFELRLFLDNIRSLAEYLASEKNLDFRADFDGDIPEIVVCDDMRLRQALVNLIGNAVKFTDSGGVGIRAAFEPGRLRFEVSDTGVGIAPGHRAAIFEAFGQVGGPGGRGVAGTGLGLYITKNIVDLMGGEISVESEPGRGSTFGISIPVGPAPSGAAAARRESATRVVYSDELRVLVVDDNDINLSVAAGLLKTLYGIDADQALSGAEAVEKAAAVSYDLIFMDHMMPEMDGVEAAARIRKLGGSRAGVPIIALTANAVAGAREMLLGSGMDDFLAKPLQKADLDRLLRKWTPERLRHCLRKREEDDAFPEERGDGVADTAGDEVLERAARIPGLDVAAGLKTFDRRRETYRQSLKLLAEKIPGMCDLTTELLKKGDIPEMTIHVHGAKSSLASVGATELSEEAKALEEAGLRGDAAFCRERLPGFAKDLRDLGGRLDAAFSQTAKEEAPREKGDKDELMCELAELQRELGEYDFDAIAARLEPLLRLDYGPAFNPLLAMIKEKADAFDYEGAKRFLNFHFPELN